MRFARVSVLVLFVAAVGCSDDENGQGPATNTGGQTASRTGGAGGALTSKVGSGGSGGTNSSALTNAFGGATGVSGGFSATGGAETNASATTGGNNSATGGTQSVAATLLGGAVSTGGSTAASSATGGIPAVTGGASATGSGGAAAETGGASASGGAAAETGGASATGGTAAELGGASATGGTAAEFGGASATGGAAAETGGVSAMGGTAAIGGASTMGGTASVTGGASAVGGTNATGGTGTGPGWSCDIAHYGTNDGCDCGCGAVDPDCEQNIVFCTSAASRDCCDTFLRTGSCVIEVETLWPVFAVQQNDNSKCEIAPPSGWTCAAKLYQDGACDCGCGIPDPACAGKTVADCTKSCSVIGACSAVDSNCSRIDPNALEQCDNSVPPTWLCPRRYYGDEEYCDCGCGAPDPDCDTLNDCSCDGVYGCSADDCTDLSTSDVAVCTDWTCAAERRGDTICDCGCGDDPDCDTTLGIAACVTCGREGSCARSCDDIDPADIRRCKG